ncbi:hypothetical protein Lal_00003797 [Lupinus albus]|nr:hypothetical protein Lal_00037545 [Lupinus albus]KAF1883556.1 hypothetical protein Lal_00003797 [Lupinus albus]
MVKGKVIVLNDDLLEVILVNWPIEILKVLFGIATSSSRLLAYRIFISRIIDHVEIDTSDVDFQLTNTCDHLLGEHLIHKMGIYWLSGEWITTIDLDLFEDENRTAEPEQPASEAGASQAPPTPPFGLAHLDAMEQ